MMTRRHFAVAGATALLSACARPAAVPETVAAPPMPEPLPLLPMPEFYGAITDEPFHVAAVPPGVVPPHLWRQQVPNPFPDEAPGTIIVDPDAGMLHLVESKSKAMRYGAGTGRDAFAWSGEARLQFCREWPRWKVPEEMIARDPSLEPFSVANGGMDPGPGNPLGARALYLFEGGRDTLYRIHGACEPQYLGQAVSSGCIRLLDHDAIDLHRRATHGATVRVLPSTLPAALTPVG